jgi:hypothetical protein
VGDPIPFDLKSHRVRAPIGDDGAGQHSAAPRRSMAEIWGEALRDGRSGIGIVSHAGRTVIFETTCVVFDEDAGTIRLAGRLYDEPHSVPDGDDG